MKRKSYAAVAATSVFALTSVATTSAHEPRILPANPGEIRLTVGFHVEPAFEDSFNAVDVILATFDGVCPDGKTNIGQPIDTGGTASNPDPDTVDLQVNALYLKKAVPPGGAPIGDIPPKGIVTTKNITNKSPLFEVFGNPGTYDSSFRPTNPGDGINGAYGFHIRGSVHAGPKSFTCPGGTPTPLAARTAEINTFFVCREGSLAPPKSFHCVDVIQPFPGDIEAGYRPSPPL